MFMKARYIIIPTVILIVVVSTLIWAFKPFAKPPEYELFEVHPGSVAATVSVSGSVVNDGKLELGFLSPGIIKTVGVEIGDQVKEGDLLVALDTSVLQYQANQARATIASAQAMLDKVRNSLRSEDRNVLDNTLANAQLAVDMANNQLQNAYTVRDNEVRGARTALDNARVAYNNALNIYQSSQSTINQSVEMAKINLSNTLTALSQAQSNYSYILSLYNSGQAGWMELQQAQAALQNATSAYNSARVQYDTALLQAATEKSASKSQLDSANAALASAEVAYNTILNTADIKVNNAINAVRSAEATYSLAEAQYYQALAPARNSDVNSASAQIASGSASLGMINTQIAQASIKAPMDGIITEVNAKENELSSMGQPAVILETTTFYIEAHISEVNINEIMVGQSIKVQFDAFEDISFKGRVANIDPAATIVMGVVNYRIIVVLDNVINDIRSSMTADLDILTDSREDVLFLSRRAITKQNGKQIVKVLTEDGVEERQVETGLVGDTETEIISGLNNGDQVILREL